MDDCNLADTERLVERPSHKRAQGDRAQVVGYRLVAAGDWTESVRKGVTHAGQKGGEGALRGGEQQGTLRSAAARPTTVARRKGMWTCPLLHERVLEAEIVLRGTTYQRECTRMDSRAKRARPRSEHQY